MRERKRNKVQGPKSSQADSPKEACHKGTTKYRNLHQLHEAYQLDEGAIKPHKGLFNPLGGGE
jgi:hypothetical protein